jgi:hypothetical protein
MLFLKPVEFNLIQQWFVDYQKRSKNFEMPPDKAEILGIYKNEELIGYFICVCYETGVVEINQGYLKQEARHKAYNKLSMRLLEELVKKQGFKRIALATNRAVGSYQKFMRECGFELTRAEFSKEVK